MKYNDLQKETFLLKLMSGRHPRKKVDEKCLLVGQTILPPVLLITKNS